MRKSLLLASAAASLMMLPAAYAANPAGNPSEPNTIENQQPGPSAQRPSDPSTSADPSARAPTAPITGYSAPIPSGDGMSTGESGFSSPAGNPSDPTTRENQQPGPSVNNPTDPAAGADPDARVPTAE